MNFMNSIYLKTPSGCFAQCIKLKRGPLNCIAREDTCTQTPLCRCALHPKPREVNEMKSFVRCKEPHTKAATEQHRQSQACLGPNH